jgi:hypothetical protein
VTDRYTADTINDDALDQLYDGLDGAYRERAHLVAYIAALHPSHIGYTDPAAIDWLVVTIETPTGQMSWHIAERDRDLFEHVRLVPAVHNVWDGHTTEEKYARLRRLTASPGRAEAALARVRKACASVKAGDQGHSAAVDWVVMRVLEAIDARLVNGGGAPVSSGPAATQATEEQNLVHALGGDRTAQTIAHTLTVHGHTLNAVRTMTYAELLAVPGIGGTSLARIRAALDGVPEPDAAAATEATEPVRQADADQDDPPVQCWHTEPGTPCDWNVCKQPERLAAGDYGTDPRKQH